MNQTYHENTEIIYIHIQFLICFWNITRWGNVCTKCMSETQQQTSFVHVTKFLLTSLKKKTNPT